LTLGRHGSRTTVGLPGSGLSATQYEPYHRRVARAAAARPGLLALDDAHRILRGALGAKTHGF
jgi:hypothetical protein